MALSRKLTEVQVREPLRVALQRRASSTLGDRPARLTGTPSAVLVPLFERDGEVHVLLTRRVAGLRAHGGQVAFPGGKRDPGDLTLETTALRETEEELGIPRDAVDVLGPLDERVTITGYVVTPFVGWLGSAVEPRPSATEIARVFAAPLHRFLGAPPNRARVLDGLLERLGYTVEGEFVWGLTAAIARAVGTLVGETLDRE